MVAAIVAKEGHCRWVKKRWELCLDEEEDDDDADDAGTA